MTARVVGPATDALHALHRLLSDYADAIDLLGSVPASHAEAQIADAVLHLAQDLCCAEAVGYVPLPIGDDRATVIRPDTCWAREAVRSLAGALAPGVGWWRIDSHSFAVPVHGRGGDLGILVVLGAAADDCIDDHVDLIAAMARVIAVPIEQARILMRVVDRQWQDRRVAGSATDRSWPLEALPESRLTLVDPSPRVRSGRSVSWAPGLERAVPPRRDAREDRRVDAAVDPVPGVSDRAGLLAALESMRRRIQQTGQQLAVAAVDLDGLGAIRTERGTDAAAEVAGQLGGRLRGLVRSGDAVGRIGTDRFVLAQVLDIGRRSDLSERLAHQLAVPIRLAEGVEVVCRGTVGLATSDGVPDSGEELVAAAVASIHRARQLHALATRVPEDPIELEAWESALAALPDGVMVQDRAGQITQVNPAAERILGLSRQALAGRSSIDPRWGFIHPDGSPFPGHRHPAMEALASGRPVSDMLMGLPRPDSELRWLAVSAVPVIGATGAVTGAITLFADITDARRARASVVGQVQRLRHAIDAFPNPFFVMDAVRDAQGSVAELTYAHVNVSAARLCGCRVEDIVGRGLIELFPSVVDSGLFDRYVAVLETGRTDTIEIPWFDENGVQGSFEVVAARVGDSLVLTATEISQRRALAAQLAASEARFLRTFGDAPVPMALIQQGRDFLGSEVLQVNASLCRFLGVAEADLLGGAEPRDGRALAPVLDELADLVPRTTGGRSQELRLRHASGQARWGVVTLTSVPDAAGDRQLWLMQCADVTERHRAEEDLWHTARHDALTGLPNRAMLLEDLANDLAAASAGRLDLAVLLLDIDDFAAVNDGLGIRDGDLYLERVAAALGSALQPGEELGRVGGDEFAVFLRVADAAAASARAEAILGVLSNGVDVAGATRSVTASAGLALATRRSTAETLMADAGSALHLAKQAGGNQCVLARTPQRRQARAILSIETELRSAVASGGLSLYYQPVIDLASRRVVAVEALTRWMHPSRGMVPPDEFIGVAERRGIIGALGDWVLDTACAQAAQWRELLGLQAPDMAINVSTRQLGLRVLPGRVAATLARYQLPPRSLTLELTESQVLAASGPATAELQELHALGVQIAVDDFGTGFAGFEYLRRLPVDVLKIDRSFVAAVDSDPTDRAVGAAMVTLGSTLGLRVVGEGIETEAQLRVLTGLGAHLGQGWLWSPAVPPGAILEIIGLDEARLRRA